MDLDEIDINFDIPYKGTRKYVNKSRYNWRSSSEDHSKRAFEVADRLFSELDLQNTTEEQDDILYYSIRYGTYSASGMTTEELTRGYHMHEFQALESLEADEGFVEEAILEAMQNGLVNSSGFISNPARQWGGDYLYKHIEKILDERLTEFEQMSTGLIDLWIETISNDDFQALVWYNGRKTIRQLFGSIDKREKRTEERGGVPYSFREYWHYWHKLQGEDPQSVIDRWESSYINWSASGFNFGGRKKKINLTKKKRLHQ